MHKQYYFFLLACFFSFSVSTQETFRRGYGLPNSFGNETGHRIESTGSTGIVIGLKDNSTTLQPEVHLWRFNEQTGQAIDSTFLLGYADGVAIPDGGFIGNTYPAPNEGFLLETFVPVPGASSDLRLTQFDSSAQIIWSAIFSEDLYTNRDFAYNTSGNLLSLQSDNNGSGNDNIYRIQQLNSDGTETSVFTLPNQGAIYSLYGLDAMPNGDLLVTGGFNGDSFIDRYTSTGTLIWTNNFPLLTSPTEGLYGAQLQMDGLHIYATGGAGIGNERTLVRLDAATGAVVWDSLLSSAPVSLVEEIEWFDDGFFVEAHDRSSFNPRTNHTLIKFAANGFSPRVIESGDFQTSGSAAAHYKRSNNTLYTVVNDLTTIGDANFNVIGFLPQAISPPFSVKFGSRGYSAAERATGLLKNDSDELLLLHVGPVDSSGVLSHVFTVEGNSGNLVNEFFEPDNNTSGVAFAGIITNDGNLVFAERSQTTAALLNLYKYDQAGNEIWRNVYPETGGFNFRILGLPLDELPNGNLLITDNKFELGQWKNTLSVLDPLGNRIDSVEFFDFNLGMTENLIAHPDGSILLVGANLPNDGTILRKLNSDLTTDWTGVLDKQLDFQLLQDGTYAYIQKINSTGVTQFAFVSADGTPTVSLGLPPELMLSASGQLLETDDEILYSAISGTGTDSLNYVFLYDIDRTGFNVELIGQYIMPPGLTNVAGLETLADGRIAIYGDNINTQTAETDLYLLVVDSNGNITSIRGSIELPGELEVYPNPSTGPVTINFTATQQADYHLRLIDMTGRPVLEKTYRKSTNFRSQLNLQNSPAGTYFLQIYDGSGQMLVRKIVRQ